MTDKPVLALLLILFAGPALACYPHNNLILCQPLQHGMGTTLRDTSVGQTSMTVNGTVAWVPSKGPRAIPFKTASGSTTFAEAGDWMLSFPGLASSDVRAANTTKFNFDGGKAFAVGITFRLNALLSADNRDIVSCVRPAVGGWELWYDGGDVMGFRNITIEAPQFGYKITDTNPHRALMAKNTLNTVYLFIDGELKGTIAGVSNINSTPCTLAIAGSNGGLGLYAGQANRLAVYNFDFTPDYIKAFAKAEFLHWQGMDNGAGFGE